MKQPNRPKTDNLAWIQALIFQKKGKPPIKPVSSSTALSPAPTSSAPPAWVKPSADPKPASGFQASKLLPTFWTVASVLSFTVNVILIVVLLVMGHELFALKRLIGKDLVGGLYENFILMDQAHIRTNIPVSANVPVNFSLTISQDTIVTLTEPTRINGAQVNLTSGGVAINSPANITLPPGTHLPVHLELTVPVNTTIPIGINVPVDIPLEQSELHKPFVGLQQVVSPYYWLLQPQINSVTDVPGCNTGMIGWLCGLFFR